jgi:ribA/ribD-fused uncharacterized protein
MITFYGKYKYKDGEKTDELDENYYLSNFYPAPFTALVLGKGWAEQVEFKTSEHYYQAMKFLHNKDKFYQIVNAETPMESKRLGNNFDGLRPDWNEEKDRIMSLAVLNKFHGEDIMEKLLATGDEELVEDSPTDYYWGWGKDHTGQNKLGKTLMELREKVKKARKEA